MTNRSLTYFIGTTPISNYMEQITRLIIWYHGLRHQHWWEDYRILLAVGAIRREIGLFIRFFFSRYINSLSSDPIRRKGIPPAMAWVGVGVWCLTSPCQYLDRCCWLIICELQWQSREGNFIGDIWIIKNSSKITHLDVIKIPGSNDFKKINTP